MSNCERLQLLLQEAEHAVESFRQAGSGLSQMAVHYDVGAMLAVEQRRKVCLEKMEEAMQAMGMLCCESGKDSLEAYIDAQSMPAEEKNMLHARRRALVREFQLTQQTNMNDMLHMLAARQVAESLLIESGVLKMPATYGPTR